LENILPIVQPAVLNSPQAFLILKHFPILSRESFSYVILKIAILFP
jgi:hypothetical protein